jgi:hypothetical protein
MTDALVIPSLHSLLPDVQGTFHDRIMALEALILQQVQVELPLRHWFCNGMYAREFTVPAGTIVTGMIHLEDSISVMHSGRVRVLTEDGEHDIVAPQTFIQHAGTKRVGLVLEDMVWTTFHACKATTVEEAELELVTNDRAEYERISSSKQQLKEIA